MLNFESWAQTPFGLNLNISKYSIVKRGFNVRQVFSCLMTYFQVHPAMPCPAPNKFSLSPNFILTKSIPLAFNLFFLFQMFHASSSLWCRWNMLQEKLKIAYKGSRKKNPISYG